MNQVHYPCLPCSYNDTTYTSNSTPLLPSSANHQINCNMNSTQWQRYPTAPSSITPAWYLHLAPAHTPVTSNDWLPALQAQNQPQPKGCVSKTCRKHTPRSSRSRMMTCRRLFERRARLHWSLGAERVRAGLGWRPRYALSGDTPS
jgi:hypothetical protein